MTDEQMACELVGMVASRMKGMDPHNINDLIDHIAMALDAIMVLKREPRTVLIAEKLRDQGILVAASGVMIACRGLVAEDRLLGQSDPPPK